MRIVSHADINRDKDLFYAMYTPGQYLIPDWLTHFGLSLGSSVTLLLIAAMALGLLGYYLLYFRVLGFSKNISLLACAVILFTRQGTHSYLQYIGGSLLQFASFPYFLMIAIALVSRRKLYLFGLPLLFLLGAGLKLSYAIIALSVVGWLFFEVLAEWRQKRTYTRLPVFAAAAGGYALFHVCLWFFYTSRGWTPGSVRIAALHLRDLLLAFSYAIASLCAGIVDLFWFLAGLGLPLNFLMLRRQAHPIPWSWIGITIAIALISGALVFQIWKRSSGLYRGLLTGFVLIHIPILTCLIAQGSVSIEVRHFWPCSALVLPGLLAAGRGARKRYLVPGAMVLVTALVYGLCSYSAAALRTHEYGRSRLGIVVPGSSQRVVSQLEQLDDRDPGRRVVFVILDPELAMLVLHHPVICLNDPYKGKGPYSGVADRVIAVIPVDRITPAHVAKLFPDEPQWHWEVVDKYYFGQVDRRSD